MTVHVVGNCTIDVFLRVDRFPVAGETVLASERYLDLGGKGANQAVMASRLGVPTRLVAPVGDDADGRHARERLAAEGLAGDLLTVPAATDQSIIMVAPSGENMIVSTAGAANSVTAPLAVASLAAVRAGDLVLLQGNLTFETTAAALQAARSAGARTMLNPAPVRWDADGLWPSCDVAVLNEVEAAALLGTSDPGEAVRRLARRGAALPVVTLGADGIRAMVDGEDTHVPAVPARVVDTAGAGDSFCGALAAGLALGLPADGALRFAAAVAAITVSRKGTQSAFPTREEAARLLAEAGRQTATASDR